MLYKCERCGSVVNPAKARLRYMQSTKYPLDGCGECVCGDLIEKPIMERMSTAPHVGAGAMADAFKKAKRVK